jgi:hypothetical protein
MLCWIPACAGMTGDLIGWRALSAPARGPRLARYEHDCGLLGEPDSKLSKSERCCGSACEDVNILVNVFPLLFLATSTFLESADSVTLALWKTPTSTLAILARGEKLLGDRKPSIYTSTGRASGTRRKELAGAIHSNCYRRIVLWLSILPTNSLRLISGDANDS